MISWLLLSWRGGGGRCAVAYNWHWSGCNILSLAKSPCSKPAMKMFWTTTGLSWQKLVTFSNNILKDNHSWGNHIKETYSPIIGCHCFEADWIQVNCTFPLCSFFWMPYLSNGRTHPWSQIVGHPDLHNVYCYLLFCSLQLFSHKKNMQNELF